MVTGISLATEIVFAFIGGYALGSIPFGVIATRLGGAGDLRKIGSGNIGATNVLRTGRRDLALITLLGDGGKGALAVVLAGSIFSANTCAIAGLGAFIGHLYPIWLRFRGGKGVATFLGILFALAWPMGLAAAATWLVTALLSRISSVSALVAAALSPAFFLFLYPARMLEALPLVIMSVLIFVRHRENIGRLIVGAEPRIGAEKRSHAS